MIPPFALWFFLYCTFTGSVHVALDEIEAPFKGHQ